MFWIGLATLIMLVSGSGDDTLAFRKRAEAMREMIVEMVSESGRARDAVGAVNEAEKAFGAHRNRLEKVGLCIEKADRKYAATEADYLACGKNSEREWKTTTDDLVRAELTLREALKPDEWNKLNDALNGKKQ